jgi:hypothetical protein
MSDGFGAPLSARFGVKVDNPSSDDYWHLASTDFINGFLNENFELYEYNLDSEDNESSSAANLDPDDELAWEIPPVQEWVKGRELDRDEVDRISHFLGFGSGFIAEEVIAGDLYRQVSGIPEPKPSVPKAEPARCLWCLVPVERRYNFKREGPLSDYDVEDFDRPIVWSDGIVMEQGDLDANEAFPNHYGDCVIACSACGAMCLASAFEKEYPRANWYPDHERWPGSSRNVTEGSCAQGANDRVEAPVTLTWSKREQTMRFLKQVQSKERVSWEAWTALQQVVNSLAYDDRQAKLNGTRFHFADAEELKKAIVHFVDGISQIIEGTLGSMSPFYQMHYENLMDENFFIHNYEVQEKLPLANMMRISGFRDFDWATPSHPAIREDEASFSGWSEFDQWIALRGKAILAAGEKGLTDWAVAVDASGNLIDWRES